MALIPKTEYPAQTDATDPAYPDGKAQNNLVPGDGVGTPLEKAWVNDDFGFKQALILEGGIPASGAPDTALVSQYLLAVRTAAQNSLYVSPATPSIPNISLSGFLDRQGIWAATESEIQDANDYLVTQLKRDVINLPPSATIVIASGLTLDPSYVSLDGHGALLAATGMATGSAVTLEGTVVPSFEQGSAVLRNFALRGPGGGSVVDGISIQPSGGAGGPSRLELRGIGVDSFLRGEWYAGPAYPVSVFGCGARNCGRGVQISGGTDVSVSRFGGSLSENILAVRVASAGSEFVIFGATMDENDQLVILTDGGLALHGCKTTAADYSITPITISSAGGSVTMVGGSLELDAGVHSFANWVDAGADSFFRGRGVRLVNTQDTSGAFGTGDGVIELVDTVSDPADTNHRYLHADRSMLIDGGFEESSIVDDVFITEADAAITDRHVVGSSTLIIDNLVARTGSQSLKYAKATGGAVSKFILASIPVTAFDHVGGVLFWGQTNYAFGELFSLTGYFAKLGVNSSGIPEIVHKEQAGSVTIVDAFDGVGVWVGQNLEDPGLAPEWATHFILEINGGSLDHVVSGEINFDDLNLNIIG